MDVTIVEAENSPAKPVVAIHVGSVRRQVRMEVNRTFQIPHPESANTGVSVTLFQQMASQAMPMDDGSKEMTCSIPVRTPSGESSEVKMNIRRCGEGAECQSRPAGQNKLEDAREYLTHHQLQQRIQNLIQDVLRAQPDDPYRYMLQSLRTNGSGEPPAVQGGSKLSTFDVPELKASIPEPEKVVASIPEPEKVAATIPEPEKPSAPLVPKPPDKPPPTNGSPRKASNLMKQQSSDGGASPKASAGERKEAQNAARASISMVLGMPKCTEEATSPFREKAQRETAKTMASSILGKARQRVLDKVISSQDVRTQARASIREVFAGTATLLSPEYQRGVTRWTVALALRSAANLIGADESRRQENFHPNYDRGSRRISMPTPIVFLASDNSSWGAWCK